MHPLCTLHTKTNTNSKLQISQLFYEYNDNIKPYIIGDIQHDSGEFLDDECANTQHDNLTHLHGTSDYDNGMV